MPTTGLFLIPLQPSQPSPTPNVVFHITRSFSATPLLSFSLVHHLFFDTSSLLPNANLSSRCYTQVLSTSHNRSRTYVGTTAPKSSATSSEVLTQITIPSTSTESFIQLLNTKLQPQWAHRQTLVVENGTSLSLRNREWILRMGDLRIASRANQTSGNLRGILIEVSHSDEDDELPNGETEKDREASGEDEATLKAILDTLLDGTGLKIDATTKQMVRLVEEFDTTKPYTRSGVNGQEAEQAKGSESSLARLYMDFLRAARV